VRSCLEVEIRFKCKIQTLCPHLISRSCQTNKFNWLARSCYGAMTTKIKKWPRTHPIFILACASRSIGTKINQLRKAANCGYIGAPSKSSI
jgi:hypothetical protein